MTKGTAGLALASINVERSKHVGRVLAFLEAQTPDVVCLQELVPDDIEPLCRRLGYAHRYFLPMCRFPEPSGPRSIGIGVLSRHAFGSVEDIRYGGGGSGSDELDRSSEEARVRTNRYAVALVDVAVDGTRYSIGTTHFPWTDNARICDFQRTACTSLIDVLAGRQLVLCGDFNAPRGTEIFDRLAGRWTDNIPPDVTTSIDPDLHRAGPLQLMVDGVFSTSDYQVSDVRLHTGVSDHCAVTATVRRRAD